MNNVTVFPTSAPAIPASLREAIEEQQHRVWRLRSLLDCLQSALGANAGIEDLDAAIAGLVEYADRIHSDLDVQVLTERATTINGGSREKDD